MAGPWVGDDGLFPKKPQPFRRHLELHPLHPSGLEMEDSMLRIVLYVTGVAAGIAACMVWRDQVRAHRKVPVQQAAEQLKAAWADSHTRA